RHTISDRNWSSDVCSSDLSAALGNPWFMCLSLCHVQGRVSVICAHHGLGFCFANGSLPRIVSLPALMDPAHSKYRSRAFHPRRRSEERRVGKEERSREAYA